MGERFCSQVFTQSLNVAAGDVRWCNRPTILELFDVGGVSGVSSANICNKFGQGYLDVKARGEQERAHYVPEEW